MLSSNTISSPAGELMVEVILSMQPWPGRVLYAVKDDPPVEYSTSLITNTL